MATRRIKKILIANRGEIAVRVIRTCRELEIQTVAVYSDADRNAMHVQMADEAYRLGPPPSGQSYLLQEKVIEAARLSGADAIHPGYGFLSENAEFAEACEDAGVLFVGPPPEAIRLMGDKTAARTLMAEAGVPMAPGTMSAIEDDEAAARAAEEIGYPVLIKAAAGGGGKGMRVVSQPSNFLREMAMAQSEALSSFGDPRVFIEKYITRPRHIEIQILADAHGHVIHLFERECSIQRRHQKVIEEAPSSVLTPEIRTHMGAAAVEAARSCGYVNAGTVEFLVDDDLNFYFMEMNTRLQVEHPVTEWITGIDLIAEQIRIAEGAELGYVQEDLGMSGHAIECRIYAEDPSNEFLPDPGELLRHHLPAGIGVRVDNGVEEGGRVEIHYDPMISKVTTWGRTRKAAIERMSRALREYEIAGVRTTIPFCRFVMDHEAFRSGQLSTHFVADHFEAEKLQDPDPALEEAAAIIAAIMHEESSDAHIEPSKTENGIARPPWIRRREYR